MKLLESAKTELAEVMKLLAAIEVVSRGITPDRPSDDTNKIIQASKQLHEKQNHLTGIIRTIEKYDGELHNMKSGSMVILNQITTVSKQRIYTPQKAEDFLYGVVLSQSAMEKINKGLIDKFIHIK